MNTEQREAVYESAQYLRQVRPIDPEEIDAYVPGRPHPAAVREVLRELAPALGFLEREDGTFAPVPDEPLSLADSCVGPGSGPGVERFPEAHARRLEDRLVARYGPGWPEGESGDRLRARIRALKSAYFAGEAVEYDEETTLAYAIYHLPDYYAATAYLLSELAADGLLPTHLRVLDVGAGVGGPALALFDTLPRDALCEYHAIEPSPAADLLEHLLGDAGRNRYPEVHRERAEDFDPAAVGEARGLADASVAGGAERSPDASNGAYDLLVVANVLSELEDPVGVLERYLEGLAPGGTVVLLAPADRETAIGLREVERAIASGSDATTDATIYAPTVELWPGASPTDRCWSFDVKPELETPGFQRRLDEAATDPEHEAGEFLNVDVQYAYSILRRDGRRKIEYAPDERRLAKLADSETHVAERIDAAAIKLSHSLSEADGGGREEREAGANPLFLIGDGTQAVDHYAVLTRETVLNRDLREAEYGSLLRFENVLVLWNDDEEAYNLVVDDETVVDAIPA